MDNWQNTIMQIYQILQITVNAVKTLSKIRRTFRKEYAVTEIRENLQNGELHFGDKITVTGTFSEYLPFVDPKFILKEVSMFPRALPRTARIDAIEDIYCGALFPLDQTHAFGQEVLPIFYGIDSRMLEHYTGEMLEMKCKITQIPMSYKGLINQNEFFVFEKEEDVVVPFGLRVLDVEPYGLVDSFKVNTWLVGNLDPPPRFKFEADEHDCRNCLYFFSFMSIDPLEWPLRYGCSKCTLEQFDASEEIKRQSEVFLKLEKRSAPYVVFPDPFKLFEVFCPEVNIFDDDQVKHSNDILLGAVKQNMETLFQHGGVLGELETPKESKISVDFQYDQRKKMLNQTFDSTKVPKWECPHYQYDPNWRAKLTKLGITEEKIEREKFKLQKNF